MISRKGNVEIEVEGKKYGFRINTWAIKESCRAIGCKSLNQLLVEIGLLEGAVNIENFMLFLLECAREYRHSEKIEGEVTIRDVYDWADEIGGVATLMAKITEGLVQYMPKNLEAPETAGQMIEV
jgi:hypothetical protein